MSKAKAKRQNQVQSAVSIEALTELALGPNIVDEKSDHDTIRLVQDLKDKIGKSFIETLLSQGVIVEFPEYAVVHRAATKPPKNLPLPRLQLRWEDIPEKFQEIGNSHFCHYELVLALPDYRKNEGNGHGIAIPLNRTTCGGGPVIMHDGTIVGDELMNPQEWQKANEALTPESVEAYWQRYRKTHHPTIFVLAKPRSEHKNQLTLCGLLEGEEDQISSLIQQGYVPIGVMGVANHKHKQTSNLLCVTPASNFDPAFANDVLDQVAQEFHQNCKVEPHEGISRAWMLHPSTFKEIQNFIIPGEVKPLENKLKEWEQQEKAIRDFGYQEKPSGWQRLFLSETEIAQQMLDDLKNQGLDLTVHTPNRYIN